MKLPFGLKLIAVFTIIGGVTSILGGVVSNLGWLEVVLGTAGIAVGVGLLLRKKWAWLLAVVIMAWEVVLSVLSLPFFPMFLRTIQTGFDAGTRALYICVIVVGYLYCVFCAYYLLRRRTRALFGIGAAKASA